MPSATATIFQTETFVHKGNTYVVSAFIEPEQANIIKIDVTDKGLPVVVTYPDGMEATLSYQVESMTKFDFDNETGLNAVDELMKTAKSDIIKLV